MSDGRSEAMDKIHLLKELKKFDNSLVINKRKKPRDFYKIVIKGADM